MLVVSSSIVEVVDKGTNIENKETCDFLSHLIKPVELVKIYLTQTSIFQKGRCFKRKSRICFI